jgi:hypothetical protein
LRIEQRHQLAARAAMPRIGVDLLLREALNEKAERPGLNGRVVGIIAPSPLIGCRR